MNNSTAKLDNIKTSLQVDEKVAAFYDFYDYNEFWTERRYENQADVISLKKLFKQAKCSKKRVIDVGVGLGRLASCYAPFCEEAIMVDSSVSQLKRTKYELNKIYSNLTFVHSMAQNLPFPNNYADIILCVRVSHHMLDIDKFIKESERIIKPGGYLIIEIANKIHIKARLLVLFNKKNSKELYSPYPMKVNKESTNETIFVNHNPKTISKILHNSNFELEKIYSVSNFRFPLFKQIIPLKLLMILENLVQFILGKFWFGPSIYFLAKKK